jgi:CheY-like chemotaxis protein
MAQSATGSGGLDGRRSLLVEDEFLVATVIEEYLRSAGGSVIGPFARLEPAMAAVERERIDLAVLDINLNGVMSYPLADELAARGIPLMFLSGYVTMNLPERFRTMPRLSKPYDAKTLIQEVRRLASGEDAPDQ